MDERHRVNVGTNVVLSALYSVEMDSVAFVDSRNGLFRCCSMDLPSSVIVVLNERRQLVGPLALQPLSPPMMPPLQGTITKEDGQFT